MNSADIFVILFVAALTAAAVLIIHGNRKSGKNSCGGDCSRCAGCGKKEVWTKSAEYDIIKK